MKFERKWIPIVSLALGFPSTILFLGIIINFLIQKNIVSSFMGYSLFFIIISYLLGMISYYAIKRKD